MPKKEPSTYPPGHEVGRVGLNEELVEGDVAGDVLEWEGAAAAVGEQGRQPDVGVGELVQPGASLLPRAREAVPVDLVVAWDVLETHKAVLVANCADWSANIP